MEAVWPDSIVEENNLAQAISKLRQVFGETPGSHSYIVTVPGRGYRFVAEVKKRTADVEEATTRRVGETGETPSSQPTQELDPQKPEHIEASPIQVRRRRIGLPAKTGWLVGGCHLSNCYRWLGSLIFRPLSQFARQCAGAQFACPGLTQFYQSLRGSPRRALQCCRLIILATKSKTPISPSACRMKLCRTLRESPISRLSVAPRRTFTKAEIRATRVRSGSNWALPIFWKAASSESAIGSELTRNSSTRRTDTHVWAQTYDRDVADLFAIQSEIAQAIAGQLHAKISPAEKLAIERPPTADLTAFDLYSRAKSSFTVPHFWQKGFARSGRSVESGCLA